MNIPYWFSNLAYWSAQVALLVLAAGFLPHLFKIRQPRVLLIYWRALIAVSLLLPFAQPWRRPENFATINFAPRFGEFAPIVLATPAPTATHWHLPSASVIAQIIGLIILAGIAARFTILALGLLKLRQFRRTSSPISNHATSSAVLDEMRLRVNTGGEFRISSDVASPVTFGLTAPVILLPERFPTLDVQYQSAIACHELLHVRRRDWAHHLSEEILRAALWFHPAIGWLIARIRLSREQVVDLEVVRLTDARKPYLEALLEFTNSRALAAIPAPPFLVERQLAERVALMLKEVRMSRTRLIASLTAIAACLAVVATLAVWTFPLKAAPQYSLPPIQTSSRVVVQVSPGIVGVTVGVRQSVPAGVVEFVPSGGVTNGKVNGVPGGIGGGVKNGVPGGIASKVPTQGVKGGVSDGVKSSVPVTLTDSYVGPTPADGVLLGTNFSRKLPLGSSRSLELQPAPKIVVTDIIGSDPQSTTGQIYRAGENGVSMPKCEYCPKPEYSEEARAENFAGTVYLQVTVLADGRAGDIKLIKGVGKGLDQQAIAVVRDKWTFKPAIGPDGDPVAATVPVEIFFQLYGPPQPPPPPPSAPPSGARNAPLAIRPLTSTEDMQAKIFTGTVTDNGKSTPSYMGVVNTQTLYAPLPERPRLARQANAQGPVTLNIVLNAEGKVIVVEYVKGPAMLVQSAIDTVRNWIIKGTHEGAAVTFQMSVEVNFSADK